MRAKLGRAQPRNLGARPAQVRLRLRHERPISRGSPLALRARSGVPVCATGALHLKVPPLALRARSGVPVCASSALRLEYAPVVDGVLNRTCVGGIKFAVTVDVGEILNLDQGGSLAPLREQGGEGVVLVVTRR